MRSPPAAAGGELFLIPDSRYRLRVAQTYQPGLYPGHQAGVEKTGVKQQQKWNAEVELDTPSLVQDQGEVTGHSDFRCRDDRLLTSVLGAEADSLFSGTVLRCAAEAALVTD